MASTLFTRRGLLAAGAGMTTTQFGCAHRAEPAGSRAVSRVTFVGADQGEWLVERITAITGAGLSAVKAVRRVEGPDFITAPSAGWALHGVRSNDRYVVKSEKTTLLAPQAGLGRSESRCAGLIPISKNEAWWKLSQDERRALMEEKSHHISVGAKYLPAIARRLFHGRDLGAEFDFLTWFEFAEADRGAFDELVQALRASEEWTYVEREVDVRLVRAL
jgi:hypothetical protein